MSASLSNVCHLPRGYLLSLAGLIWPLLWPLSFLFLLLLASLSSAFALRRKQAENASRLSAEEIARVIWKQSTRSISLTLLLALAAYYIYSSLTSPDSSYNSSPDIIALGIIIAGSTLAGLIWLIRHLSRRRISQPPAREQAELEEPLLQHVSQRLHL